MSDDSKTTGLAPYSGPKPSKPGPSIMPNDADAARRIHARASLRRLACGARAGAGFVAWALSWTAPSKPLSRDFPALFGQMQISNMHRLRLEKAAKATA